MDVRLMLAAAMAVLSVTAQSNPTPREPPREPSIRDDHLRNCEELRLAVFHYANFPRLLTRVVDLHEEIENRPGATQAERDRDLTALSLAVKNARVDPPLYAPMHLAVITYDNCFFRRKPLP